MAKRKPTIIGDGATPPKKQRKATVIGGNIEGKTIKKKEPRKATVIPSTQKTTVVKTATVVPGVVRKGIEVSLDKLKEKYPLNEVKILRLVQKILKHTYLDTIDSISASQWGMNKQSRYQDLVNESLQLLDSRTMQDALQYSSRLQNLLGEIAEEFEENKGVLSMFTKNDPKKKLDLIREELNQLKDMLGNILPDLRQIQRKLEISITDFEKLYDDIMALAVSANFLADDIDDTNLSSNFSAQEMSLTKMAATIKEGIVLRKANIKRVDALADKIQDIVLVSLPGWIETATLEFRGESLTETTSYRLKQDLQDILRKLQRER